MKRWDHWQEKFPVPGTREGIIARREQLKLDCVAIERQLADDAMNCSMPPDERADWEHRAKTALYFKSRELKFLKIVLRSTT